MRAGLTSFNPSPLLTQYATEGDRAILKRHFDFEPDENHRGEFRGNIITEHTSDFFMFCLTKLAPPAGKAVFCKESPGFSPYDACVKVSNISDFFMDLWIGAHAVKIHPSGHRVDIHRDFDTDPKRDEVTYEPVNRDLGYGLDQPNPFNKDPIFRKQKEYRLVAFPVRDLPYDRIVVTSPAITKHLERVV